MRLMPRIVATIATLLSVPLAGFALAGAGYISYSLATEPWYRQTFAAYGIKLLVLYVGYALGVSAAAALVLGFAWARTQRRRRLQMAAVVAGVVAAALLELTFWSDISEHHAHTVVFWPFLAWALYAFNVRRRDGHAVQQD